jgi:shikimate kinase
MNHRAVDNVRISLIGMAGTGKSTWAKRLKPHGFEHLDCDKRIAERLSLEPEGTGDLIGRLGRWMGLPWERKYVERSERYQRTEKEVMTDLIQRLKDSAPSRNNVVVDTAGSVIYTGKAILDELAELTRIVHLETPQKVQEEMLKDFIKRPGPVIWNGMFDMKKGESPTEALARCYPILLSEREMLYGNLAHITIPYSVHHAKGSDIRLFLKYLSA